MINLLLLKAGWGQNSINDSIFAIFNIQTALVNLPNKSAYTWSSEAFRYPKNFWGLLQTEVLKQLSSMGRLVICAGDGAVQSYTNL